LFRFFDPKEDRLVVERRLPHWTQPGTVTFITWRTWDSLPQEVLQVWLAERDAWLSRHGVDPEAEGWRVQLARLPLEAQCEFHNILSARWETSLDECHGTCVLRRADLSRILADSLRHFDGDRYCLTDFVVMPNHVHILVVFPDAEQMLKQCESWKHFTAVRINRELGRQGRFWQVDDFDHLVRSPEQFEYLRDYIAENPVRALLKPGEFVHCSIDLPGSLARLSAR